MLQQEKLFALSQAFEVSGEQRVDSRRGRRQRVTAEQDLTNVLDDADEQIVSYASTTTADLLLVVTSGGRICALDLPEQSNKTDAKESQQQQVMCRQLPWFKNDEFKPKCVAFSPEEDFCLVACESGHLFILQTKLISPNFKSTGQDINRRYWSSRGVTSVHCRTSLLGTSSVASDLSSPTCMLWWTSHDFRSFVVVGTKRGDLASIDLATGELVAESKVVDGSCIKTLDRVVDATLDCTYVLITTEAGKQYRMLLEQRTSAYVWGCGSSTSREPRSLKSTSEESLAHSASSTASKSRFAGLKQLSAAGFANLKSKLNEGKRLIDRRLSTSISSVSSSSSNIELGVDALESVDVPLAPQDVSNKIGDTRVSVQRSSAGLQILAGLFPETAVMTMHNCELEVLPQSALRLPKGSEKLLLLGKLILVAAQSSQSQLYLVSAHHAELQVDTNSSRGQESILQSFTLKEKELVLGLNKCQNVITYSGMSRNTTKSLSFKGSSNQERKMEEVKAPTMSTSRPNSHSSSSSSSISEVTEISEEQKRPVKEKLSAMVAKGLEEAKARSQGLFQRCIIVTSRAVYILHVENNPSDVFLELAMRGGDLRKAEYLAVSFGLGSKSLFELAGDMRLQDRDFSAAVSLYRQAGAKHLKVVLKFACSGYIYELLSYLSVLFKTPNLEVSPSDRVHMSNLAMMSYFQQILTKETPTSRIKFRELIQAFLDENKWYDESLAIRLSSQTKEWDILSGLNNSRGLNYEMVDSVVSILLRFCQPNVKIDGSIPDRVSKNLREMNSIERNGVLACLLHINNVECVFSYLPLCQRLLDVLSSTLTMLEEQGLFSVLQQCGPINAGLRHSYFPLILQAQKKYKLADNSKGNQEDEENDGDDDDLRTKLRKGILNLSISSALLLLKKRQDLTRPLTCDQLLPSAVIQEKKNIPQSVKFEDVPTIRDSIIAAGAAHVLYRRSTSLFSWGSTAFGVCGHGATPKKYALPKEVAFFGRHTSSIRVISVAAGKMHSLALTNFGLFAWGSSKYGQLGLGSRRISEQRPALIKSIADVPIISVVAGQFHSVALDANGRVWTWGWGVHGQLGLGDIDDVFEPQMVRYKLRKQIIVQISAGYAHTMVLTKTGQVWVFGCGLFGQLGGGDTKKSTIPIKVDALSHEKIERISAGFFHSAALSAEVSNRLYVWGCNPQILRLEAQQRKRQRISQLKRESSNSSTIQNGKQPAKAQPDQVNASTSMVKDLKKQAKTAVEELRSSQSSPSNSTLSCPEGPAENGKAESGNTCDDHMVKPNDIKESMNDTSSLKSSEGNGSEEDSLHLMPALVNTSTVDGFITEIACGNQHTLLLSDRGMVYSFGRNVDGQLGTSSRKEEKFPALVKSLEEEQICQIAAGGDYSLGVSDSGTVFGWGSNGAAQLGGLPAVDESDNGTGANTKIVVMKSTRRVIRFPNNNQNICDTPKPIPGLTEGVYSEEWLSGAKRKEMRFHVGLQMITIIKNFEVFNCLNKLTDVETLLYLMLDTFHPTLDVKKVLKKCLVSDNLFAAAKLCLLRGQSLQAFDFMLQLLIRKTGNKDDCPHKIFNSFMFFLKHISDEESIVSRKANFDNGGDEVANEPRCQLLERLIACWQDQSFSFLLLEKMCLESGDMVLLQTLVLTLFRPDDERQASGDNQGPTRVETGPKLVDLFTPEFCLKIGDRFVRSMRREQETNENPKEDQKAKSDELPRLERQASVLADQWLRKKNNNDG